MKKTPRFLVLAAALLLLTGCLEKETTHTLYLDATSGELTWMILERDVRSDEDSREVRDAEEREYLDLFAAARHPVAAGLAVLGPDALEARMLRAERPYTTMTTARFASVEAMAEELLYRLALPGRVELQAVGDERHLTVTIDDVEGGEDPSGEGEAVALVEERDRYRLFLNGGVFTDAAGFEIADDGRSAVLAEVDEDEVERQGHLELRLSWRVEAP